MYKSTWHKRLTPSKKHLQQEIHPHLVGLRSPYSWQKSPNLCPFIYYVHHLSLQIGPSHYELHNGFDLISHGVGCLLHPMEGDTCSLPYVTLTVSNVVNVLNPHWVQAQQIQTVIGDPCDMVIATVDIIHKSLCYWLQHDFS